MYNASITLQATNIDGLHGGCLIMRYYAQYNDTGKLIAIGTGYGGTEITEAEYNALLSEIREKAALVDKLYNGEITIDAVPVEWQEEIQRRVTERQEAEQAEPEETELEDAIAALKLLGVEAK